MGGGEEGSKAGRARRSGGGRYQELGGLDLTEVEELLDVFLGEADAHTADLGLSALLPGEDDGDLVGDEVGRRAWRVRRSQGEQRGSIAIVDLHWVHW